MTRIPTLPHLEEDSDQVMIETEITRVTEEMDLDEHDILIVAGGSCHEPKTSVASSGTTSLAGAALNPQQPSPLPTGQVEDTSPVTQVISAQQLSAQSRLAEVSAMDCLLGPLPPDWTRHQSQSHPELYYYYNERTGENIWSRPVPIGLVETPCMKTAKSNTENPNTNTANLPCSPEDIAWSFGVLIWQVFNPDPHCNNINLSALSNVPKNVRAFYRKCLHKNPMRRPSIDMLRAFLVRGSQHGEDEEFAGGAGGGSAQLTEPQEMEAQPKQLAGGVGGGQSVHLQGGEQPIGPERGGSGAQEVPGEKEARCVDTAENDSKLYHEESVGEVDYDDGNAGVGECPVKHVCPICKRCYSRRQHLRRHVEFAHASTLDELVPKKQFPCEECSKSYNRVKSLKRHLLYHRSRGKKMKKKPVSSTHGKLGNKLGSQAPLCAYEMIRRNNIIEREEMFEALEIEKAKDLFLKSL